MAPPPNAATPPTTSKPASSRGAPPARGAGRLTEGVGVQVGVVSVWVGVIGDRTGEGTAVGGSA